LRLIFTSEDYHTSFTPALIDFQGDGTYELLMWVSSFFYFELSYAQSPAPIFVLSYDKANGKYVVSSKNFSAYILRNENEKITKLNAIEVKPENYDTWLSALFTVFLDYVYAGQEQKAWRFYDINYRFSNKEIMKQKLIEQLRSDAVYKIIYSR
jgi:hypothetical protein